MASSTVLFDKCSLRGCGENVSNPHSKTLHRSSFLSLSFSIYNCHLQVVSHGTIAYMVDLLYKKYVPRQNEGKEDL